MKTLRLILMFLLVILGRSFCYAQVKNSMYGDVVQADIKMHYVYDYNEALKLAKEQNKLVFFNCFVDWAVPCHGMNLHVFSNQEFCDFMNKNFINLWMDMTTDRGRALAQKYGVKTYAQYLILDSDGNVVQRIVGGSKLPEFKQLVEIAMSDKTSLRGTARSYAEGDHSKANLYNYLKALRTAGEDSLFTVLGKEYISYLKPSDFTKKENWMLIRLAIPDKNCSMFRYLLNHKSEFGKNIGEQTVNAYIESLVCSNIMQYATGSCTFNKDSLEVLHQVLDYAQLPDTCVSYVLYEVGKLRGEKKYQEMLRYLDENGHYLTVYRNNLELSLNLPDMTGADKNALIAYLNKAAEREKGTSAGKSLASFVQQLSSGAGINFDHGPFKEVLERAKRDGKLVFMDCYTSWCGPCRMMSSVVFTREDVGNAFNPYFVSFKVDMEKGEGIDLARTYNVHVFPTMLILDTDGRLVHRFAGARSPQDLIQIANENKDVSVGYTAMKTAYDAGERTPKVVYNYVRHMTASGEMNEADGAKLMTECLNGLDDKALADVDTWPLIEAGLTDYTSQQVQRLIRLYPQLVTHTDSHVVYRKLETLIFPPVISYLRGEISEQAVTPLIEAVKEAALPEEGTLKLLTEIMSLYETHKFEVLLTLYKDRVAKLVKPIDRANLDVLLPDFLKNADAALRGQALEYACAEASVSNDKLKDDYARLIARLGGE